MLIVNGRYAEEAVRLAGDRPGLSQGLHVNFTNEAQRLLRAARSGPGLGR